MVRDYNGYIRVIRQDLQLPETCRVVVTMHHNFKTRGGYARYNAGGISLICLNRTTDHAWNVAALMHEFRHIWQYHTGILKYVWRIPQAKLVGMIPGAGRFYKVTREKPEWVHLWNGVEYQKYNRASYPEHPNFRKYLACPWEVDAREYENEIHRLFPCSV